MSTGLFLDDAELRELTGFANPAEAERMARRDFGAYIIHPTAEVIPAAQFPAGGDFAGLYMLFDAAGMVLYVGKSEAVGRRCAQHYWAAGRGKRCRFAEYAAVAVPWDFIDGMEVAHIHALLPPENSVPRAGWKRHLEAVAAIKKAWEGTSEPQHFEIEV